MAETYFSAPAGVQVVEISRLVNAPREQVFAMYIDKNHVAEWWGPAVLKNTIEEMDVRPGGKWRIIQADPDGSQYAFHGFYHEALAPERVTYTFEYEGEPGHIHLETVYFEERGQATLMTNRSVFQSVEDRDGMVNAGMESGSRELIQRFAELVETL